MNCPSCISRICTVTKPSVSSPAHRLRSSSLSLCRRTKGRGQTVGPLENLYYPPADVDKNKSINVIITNALSSVITDVQNCCPSQRLKCRHRIPEYSREEDIGPPLNNQYAVKVSLTEEHRTFTLFFRLPTGRIGIYIGTRSNTIQIATSVLEMSSCLNMIN